MSEQTPSQAEGERQPHGPADDETQTSGHRDAPRTTPSQAEGGDVRHKDDEDDKDGKGDEGDEGEEGSKAWEAGWSGP